MRATEQQVLIGVVYFVEPRGRERANRGKKRSLSEIELSKSPCEKKSLQNWNRYDDVFLAWKHFLFHPQIMFLRLKFQASKYASLFLSSFIFGEIGMKEGKNQHMVP